MVVFLLLQMVMVVANGFGSLCGLLSLSCWFVLIGSCWFGLHIQPHVISPSSLVMVLIMSLIFCRTKRFCCCTGSGGVVVLCNIL